MSSIHSGESSKSMQKATAQQPASETGLAYKLHQLALARQNLIHSKYQRIRVTSRHLNDAVFIPMQKIARAYRHAQDVYGNVRANHMEMRVAGDRAARKKMKRKLANGSQVTHPAVTDQPDRSQSRKDRGHDLARMRRAVAIAANLLHHDNRRLRSALNRLKKINKSALLRRVGGTHGFYLSGDCVPAHNPQLRKQTTQMKRRKTLRTRTNLEALDSVSQRRRVDPFQTFDQIDLSPRLPVIRIHSLVPHLLPMEAQRKLDLSGVGNHGSNRTGAGRSDTPVWQAEIRSVQDVKEFRAKLQTCPFGQTKIFVCT